MTENNLSDRQLISISHYLDAPSIEETCRRAEISKPTFYSWLKDDNFKTELKKQRDILIKESLDKLKCAINKATEGLIKLMESSREDVRRLACSEVLKHALKSIEIEEIEERLEKVERIVLEKKTYK